MNKNNFADGEMSFKNGLENKLPVLCGEIGSKYFVFENGTKTKTFYDCGSFVDDNSSTSGFYPILDENGKVVEYLSLLGKFYIRPTKVGNAYYMYLKNEPCFPYIKVQAGLGINYKPYYATNSIPFAMFANKAFREAVANEEERRIAVFRENDMFFNQISYLNYKHYTKQIIDKKLKQYYTNKSLIELRKQIANMKDGKAKRKAEADLHTKEYFFKQNFKDVNF